MVVLGLLDLANAYCETDLKTRCQHLIRQSVTVDNVAALYATGMKYEALVIISDIVFFYSDFFQNLILYIFRFSQDLEEYCLRFAVHHLTAVVQSDAFSKLDESSLKQFITRVAQMGAFRY